MNAANAPEKNTTFATGDDTASGHAMEVETFPLSFAQQRLWFFDQFEHAKAAYNLQTVLSVKGPLNVPALQRSLNEIIKRHESLRTRFALTSEGSVQVIEPELRLELGQTDVSGLTGDEQGIALDRLVQKDWEKEFDLTRLPLIRASLAKRNTDDHVLLLTMHHIISDGWSMRVLFREVGQLYGAYVAGEKPQMEELEVQYADFALWQQEWLQGERLQRQLDYWRKALEGAPELLELPLDKTRPATQSYRGAEEGLVLGETATRKMKQLGQNHGTTLYMTLVAAFCILLKRYSGASDIVVGTPVANRNQQELEALIGFFVNTLALRLKLVGNPTFSEVLRQVREVVVSAFEHQDMPFQKLVEELQPERNLSHHPLFQVMFVLQDSHGRRVTWPGLQVSSLKEWPGAGIFDLIWSLREHDEHISIQTRYSTDLFEAATVQRMMRHYERVLEELSRDASQRISEFQLLSDGEWKQIIGEWTRTELPYEREKTVAELFEEQVRRVQQAMAVVFKEERFTYKELDQRANQLANYLKQLGVGPEVGVGACMQRGPRMILALLAIWKAGGVYVPLDPDYPPERLSYMLLDTDPLVVLSETGTETVVPVTNASIIDIKGDWANIAKMSESSPESSARAGNAAYIIYTSGSTGRPKGVVIEHRSVSNLIRAQRETFAPGESDRILQFFSFSFDVSIFAILMALGSGATLVLATREELLPGSALVELLESESITLAVMPPLVLSHMPDAELPALRKIILGGEAWGEELMKRWGKGRRFFNSYGPTETTVQAAVGEYHLGAGRPSIGRPINNARIYLLDLEGNPVPVGVAGELHIGGDGLGRGYLDCALTAAKFVPDPFSEIPGKRFYRTGDWARWLPDGNIDLLGRKDGQIKFRGFRVELGEIESVLSEHLLVRQCAIVALQEKRNTEKRLVAYVTLMGGKSPAERELRNYLKEKLPDYMVPAQFMILEEFPLNHSGKIDRNRLPSPQVESSTSERGPRTPEEEIICGLFAEVLERERVGIDDNFFDLGGHSLKATRLASRIRAVLGRELPLIVVFESPTVSGLAGRLRQAETTLPSHLLQKRPDHLPLSYGQQRLWFIDQLQGKSSEYNVADALRLHGPLDYAALQHSINAIVARHEVLRTHFTEKNGSPAQIIELQLQIPILVEDLSTANEAERHELIRGAMQQESEYPFELARGPLLRVRLLRVAEHDHILLRTCHHIITDGWSQGIFNRELMSLYDAFHGKQEAPLAPIPLQYADYALWQRKSLDATLNKQLVFWKEQLTGIPEELPLAKDRPRPARQTFAADGHTTVLTAELVTALKELGRSNQGTLYMTLLAGFAVLLERYSGQQDIVVGSPIANRQEEQWESLLGFFVNSLVMRIQLDPAESFSVLLAKVRKTALAAYMHQDLPFERLVEELSPQRSLNKTPIYQVMFALQNTPQETMRLKDLELKRLPAEQLQTLFDLELYAFEHQGEIRLFWVYNRDLFDRWRIEQMARHFVSLLESAAGTPDAPLHEISMLKAEEALQLLLESSGREQLVATTDSVHKLFEQQVQRTPEALAIRYAGRQLTYRELNEHSNLLAHYLVGLGVGCEVLVGLYMERCPESIVALIAILKAGGAYVPLDPAYPTERLRFMAEDAGVKFLLTQQKLANRLQLKKAVVVQVDADWKKISQSRNSNLSARAVDENAAYVIYTSGSTGKPKGVLVSHHALCNQLLWLRSEFSAGNTDRVLQKTSLSFDAAAAEIFFALATGAELILAEPDESHDVDQILRLIAKEKITFVDLPPSLLATMLNQKEINECACLRWIFCGGEILPLETQARVKQLLSAELCNLYGPTETTIQSTFHKCRENLGLRSVPIGKPIANTELYVLDTGMALVPRGILGELYIGGAGLARGYLNRPDFTAERFLPNPFSVRGGDRLYRTGDLVSRAADGNLEFMGRIDDQVKIRGYRIEPEEIAAVLRDNPAVEQAVVAVIEEKAGGKRLIAYVVARVGSSPSSSALRIALKEQLPDYMVPSQFVFLDALPLTRTGKVDRSALPRPQVQERDSRTSYVSPQTPLEQMLAQIWMEALQIKRVGLDDNFFDLGGHSLLIPAIRSRIQQTLQRPVAIMDFFAHPTVRSLADRLGPKKEDKSANIVDSQSRAARQREQLRARQSARKPKTLKETVQ